MSYTGDVTVGGPADSRELPGLTITKVAVGPMNNNAYLLRCTSTGELLLIDAANEAGTLLSLLGGAVPARSVTTHRHQDHWQALAEVTEASRAAVVAHPHDAGALPVPVAEPVEGGDRVRVGRAELEVIHLRGHTPGSAFRFAVPVGRRYRDIHVERLLVHRLRADLQWRDGVR